MARTVNYFCFGSNLDPYVMNVERGVKPIETRVCQLPGHKLTFNIKGSWFVEPSFANLKPLAGQTTWGVCHTLKKKDFKHIQSTEGYQYYMTEVDVKFADGSVEQVYTLADMESTQIPTAPSKRYRRLILNGAEHYQLPDDYIKFLKEIEVFHIPIVSSLFSIGLKIAKPLKFRLSR